jgi:hypothetical protein
MAPQECRVGTAPTRSASASASATRREMPDPPARIWLSRIVIAARAVTSSSTGPTAAQ